MCTICASLTMPFLVVRTRSKRRSHADSAPMGHLRVPVSVLRSAFLGPPRSTFGPVTDGVLFHTLPRQRKGGKSSRVCSHTTPRQMRGEKLIRVNRQRDKYRKCQQEETEICPGVNAIHYTFHDLCSARSLLWSFSSKKKKPPGFPTSSPGWRSAARCFPPGISFFVVVESDVKEPSNPPNLHISPQSLRVRLRGPVRAHRPSEHGKAVQLRDHQTRRIIGLG
jgi:hypothetical protein